MALAGLLASPIASASENGNGSISATFPLGSSVLTKDQKAAIKKALASSGTEVAYTVTGTAGKLPGVSNSSVQRLAKKRAQAIKAYLVSLGVSNTRVTTQVKTTEIGIVPKSIGSYPTPEPTPTVTAAAAAAPAAAPAAPAAPAGPAVTYTVGQRGPGGGIVFYASATSFTSAGSACGTNCWYLEVAPATWQDVETFNNPIHTTVANDALYKWTTDTTTNTGQNYTTASTEGAVANRSKEKLNWKIGEGFYNTSTIRSTSEAKNAVLAYAGNSTAGQWFIPSMNELNELCKYARGQTTGDLTVQCANTGTLKTGTANDLGGFVVEGYHSSSEGGQYGSGTQSFSTAIVSENNSKGASLRVRPIRAF
jgi:hypothetical protein